MPAGDDRKVDTQFLAGEVHALVTFAQVLAATHHNPSYLLSDFQAAEQVGLAHVESQLAGEKLVLGFQFAVDRIRRAIESAMES